MPGEPICPPTAAPLMERGGLVNRAWLIFFQWIFTKLAEAGTGSVTHTNPLTANQIVIGSGAADLTALGSLGTAVQVLHGNAAGAPSFSAVALAADVSGILPKANGGTGVDNTTQTYAPTLTAVANLDAIAAVGSAFYARVGNIVSVFGAFDADPTALATLTQFRMSLPIASNFGAAGGNECGGTAANKDLAGEVVTIGADTTNDAALFEWTTASTASRRYRFSFSYVVI